MAPLGTQGVGKQASERGHDPIKLIVLSTTFGQGSNFLVSRVSNSAPRGAGAKRRGGCPGLAPIGVPSNNKDEEEILTNVRYLNPETLSKPPGYSHVVEVTGPGRLVYIAGQLGLDRSGRLVGGPDDVRAQVEQAFENLKGALAATGATMADIVKINSYLTDMTHLSTFREVRNKYLNLSAPPASTLVAISELAVPGALFEIEAVAVLSPR
jgi:enamine deaminase RidA (YjgF/YER057c/UK114 family)